MTDRECEPNAEDNSTEGKSCGQELLSRLSFSVASFHAVFAPVSITMILAALTVVYINTEETRQQGAEVYSSTYEVLDLEEGNSAQNFFASVANTLIIVSVVCAMTFVVVLLYRYRCMKIFFGYMIVVTAMLLGYFTSNILIIAIEKYNWKIDKVSFAFVMWNYAIVGTKAIFFPTGIPRWVTQGYTIACAVVLAWQLSYFNEWTAWTLLVMLALYDLFAVLAPCGPLKALANLMSQSDAPSLPGLLYEASLPDNVQRPGVGGSSRQESDGNSASNQGNNSQQGQSQNTVASEKKNPKTDSKRKTSLGSKTSTRELEKTSNQNDQINSHNQANMMETNKTEVHEGINLVSQETEVEMSLPTEKKDTANGLGASDQTKQQSLQGSTIQEDLSNRSPEQRKSMLPLALAKLYKLQVIDVEGMLDSQNDGIQRAYSADEIRAVEWTPAQLRTEVTVVFPSRGGRIEKANDPARREGYHYLVFSRSGQLLRTFVVTHEGRVMQVIKRENSAGQSKDSSIKLGLGDFIFYSVLVSKAALYSFTSFAACMLVVLVGLGGTLMLLGVYGKALPALPISIFLGVVTFLFSRFLMEPWIHEVLRLPFYI